MYKNNKNNDYFISLQYKNNFATLSVLISVLIRY